MTKKKREPQQGPLTIAGPTISDVAQAFEAALQRLLEDGLDADTAREGLAVCAGRMVAAMVMEPGVTREQFWARFLEVAREEEARGLRLLGEIARGETVQ